MKTDETVLVAAMEMRRRNKGGAVDLSAWLQALDLPNEIGQNERVRKAAVM